METAEKSEKEYAGFWIRFIAYLIDSIIIGIPIAIITFVIIIVMFGAMGVFEYSSDPIAMETELSGGEVISIVGGYLIIILIGIFGSVAYFAGFHSSKLQATPGKRLLGLKVVDLDGNRISFWRALGRYFAMILSGIMYIGYIMAAFTEKKQALHDMIAGTYVIKSN